MLGLLKLRNRKGLSSEVDKQVFQKYFS
jgi:hypothetical protein